MPSKEIVGSALSIPWSAFVAAFLYYTALTLVTIGGGEMSAIVVAASYLMPAVVYAAVLIDRAVAALSRMPVELWPTSNMILH